MEVQVWFMSKMFKANAGLSPDLMASMQQVMENPSALPAVTAPATPKRTAPAAVAQPAVSYEPIPAQLFLSDSCGWCKKLKQSGFPGKFKAKYAGEVDLQIYEVHSEQGKREFSKAVKKHNLSGGVPLLVIGDSVIHGYAENMMELADQKVRAELKKRGPVEQGPSIVSITMEDAVLSGPASFEDKAKMQAYLGQVRDNNEAVLESVKNMFPKAVWNQTLMLVTQTENELNRLASTSTSYADFLQKASPVEAAQQQQIEQFVRQHVKNIH